MRHARLTSLNVDDYLAGEMESDVRAALTPDEVYEDVPGSGAC